MNPDLVYSRHRDRAFANQLVAPKYGVFVAMPFGDRFSYRSADIYRRVFQAAALRANALLAKDRGTFGSRRFAVPRRIDDQAQTARSIGDEIIQAILDAHVVLADLTFCNDGVMLEVGAALALKPTQQIILVTQGKADELHFDVKGNVIIEYSPANGVKRISDALVAAVRSFERQRGSYLTTVKHELSADAMLTMNWIGAWRSGYYGTKGVVHEGWPPKHLRGPGGAVGADGAVRFQLALRELLGRGLIWNYYSAQSKGRERWSYRATALGWMFIENTWKGLKRPAGELTEPPPSKQLPGVGRAKRARSHSRPTRRRVRKGRN